MRKYTDAKKEGNRKWDAANLDRISIALPKGQKELIKEAAAQNGESVNKFIARLIEAELDRLGVNEQGGGF
jgi:predicted HicB family RNase H-like nuclease